MNHNISTDTLNPAETQIRALADSLRNALSTFSVAAELLPRWLPEDDTAILFAGIMQRQVRLLAEHIVALEQSIQK